VSTPVANLLLVSLRPVASCHVVVDTGGKFTAGIIDTGGKFATGVNNTSGVVETGSNFPPVSLTPVAN
jgi:hypothetical protein